MWTRVTSRCAGGLLCVAALACDGKARDAGSQPIVPSASGSSPTETTASAPLVTVLSLLTRQESFDGKEVIAIGYLNDDANALFLSSEHAAHSVFDFGVLLSFDDCNRGGTRSGVSHDSAILRAPGYVAVRGKFVAKLRGGFGGLCEITHISEYGLDRKDGPAPAKP